MSDKLKDLLAFQALESDRRMVEDPLLIKRELNKVGSGRDLSDVYVQQPARQVRANARFSSRQVEKDNVSLTPAELARMRKVPGNYCTCDSCQRGRGKEPIKRDQIIIQDGKKHMLGKPWLKGESGNLLGRPAKAKNTENEVIKLNTVKDLNELIEQIEKENEPKERAD